MLMWGEHTLTQDFIWNFSVGGLRGKVQDNLVSTFAISYLYGTGRLGKEYKIKELK